METQESCDRIIEVLKGGRLPGHSEPLQVKFADSGGKKKQSEFTTIAPLHAVLCINLKYIIFYVITLLPCRQVEGHAGCEFMRLCML